MRRTGLCAADEGEMRCSRCASPKLSTFIPAGNAKGSGLGKRLT